MTGKISYSAAFAIILNQAMQENMFSKNPMLPSEVKAYVRNCMTVIRAYRDSKLLSNGDRVAYSTRGWVYISYF